MGTSKEGAAQADRAGKESSWGEELLAPSTWHCTITTLRPRSSDYIKKQHRKDFGSFATSVFLMLQSNLHTQGSKKEMLIIPIKDHLREISSRLKPISCLISITPDRHGHIDLCCLKAFMHLSVLKHSIPHSGLFKV